MIARWMIPLMLLSPDSLSGERSMKTIRGEEYDGARLPHQSPGAASARSPASCFFEWSAASIT
jgi:hypothetical protein